MIVAWMALVALLAATWLTRPVWRASLDERQRRRAANVAAFRQRQAELVRDEEVGLFDAATAASLKAELEARLLRDAQEPDTTLSGGRRSFAFAALVAVVVAGAAGAGYYFGNTWPVQLQIASGAPAPATGGAPPDIETMVARLAQRLQEHPEDAQGWAMLGRSYFVMQRFAESAQAYSRANALTGNQEPDLLVNEGEALALANDRNLLGRPAQLFDAALAIAPEHAKALWYAGLAADQGGQADVARTHWTALEQQELPDEVRQMLKDRLAALPGGGGAATPAVATASAPAAAADAPVSPNAPTLRVAVRVKPELAARVPSDATLFVFAKAASGPPMPLAVYRGLASELPREVKLDDSMAMAPAMKISMFDRWTVTARISRAGQPQAASGDIQGSLTVGRADLGDSALALVLDQVVP